MGITNVYGISHMVFLVGDIVNFQTFILEKIMIVGLGKKVFWHKPKS